MSDKIRVFVCTQGKKCPKKGGKEVCAAFETAASDQGVEDSVTIKGTKCLKLCKGAPGVVVMPEQVKYGRVDADDAAEILSRHVKGQGAVERLLFSKKKKKKKDKKKKDK